MPWSKPNGMNEYLEPTGLCDSDSEEIKEKARLLVQNVQTPKKAALGIFYYVRDQILFGMDNCDVKGSETMKKGMGFCITKTNLQVALFRAAGIPARYHQVVLSKNSLRGIIPPFGLKVTPDKIWWHPWCECYLQGKWIACDSMLDKSLYDAIGKKAIINKEQIPTIDWDGEKDLNTMRNWIIEDIGTFHCLDDVFIKVQKEVLPPKILTAIFFRISNRYTNKLRRE